MSVDHAVFLIESGPMLEAVKQYIADCSRAHEEAKAFCLSIGATRYMADSFTFGLRGVVFEGEPLPGFKRPDKRGVCYPKVKSDWAHRMEASCPGIGLTQTQRIAALWPVPTDCAYESDGGRGWCCLGNAFEPLYFVYPGEEGPYGVAVPDVPAEIQAFKESGSRVTNIPEDYKLAFEGLKRLSWDEWDLLCLQYKIARDKAAKASQA